jgi:phosphatidylserine/phosphatidylglycerophosphate/cardiolipin synthase-like enzyme
VYFNHSDANAYSDPYRHIQRHGDDLEAIIVSAIAEAHSSIDIAVQELNLPQIAIALREQARAGVAVRLILDNQYNHPWQPLSAHASRPLDSYQQSKHAEQQQLIDANHNGKISEKELMQRDAVRILEKAQLPLIDDTADGSKGSGLMHHKFMVIDHKTVVVGSANWTLSDIHGDFANLHSRGNANALLRIQSPEVAQILTDEFELMWGDGLGKRKDSLFGLQKPVRSPQITRLPSAQVTVQFSPQSESEPWQNSTNGLISRTLSQAQQAINLALFVFSDQGIADTLAQMSHKGVKVQALVDSNFAYRSYSEILDMLGTALPDERCRYEAQNHPWQKPLSTAGTIDLPEGDKLHHKFGLMDNETVIIGSHNWSTAANHTNDEDLLIIRNSTVAAHFNREFDRLLTTAKLGLTKDLQDKIQAHRKQCGL